MRRDCGHLCCKMRDNDSHTHTIEPADCLRCNIVQYGRPWVWTDDPQDPCWVCVNWRNNEPHDAYGDMLPRVCCEAHDDCLEMLRVVRAS